MVLNDDRNVSSSEGNGAVAKGKFLDLHRHLPSTIFVVILLVITTAVAAVVVFTGVYNIGADAPHSKIVTMALQQVRERAIVHHSRNIVAPADLNAPQRLATGAGLYNEMCSGCHLGPGLEKSEMSQGLYPPAPELATASDRSAAQQFWMIKHGVKLSAMPAWGKTHDDQLIWDMVSFIRTLPKMSSAQYQAAIATAPGSHDEMMKDMPGMAGMAHGDAAKPETAGHAHGASAPPPSGGHAHAQGTKPHQD